MGAVNRATAHAVPALEIRLIAAVREAAFKVWLERRRTARAHATGHRLAECDAADRRRALRMRRSDLAKFIDRLERTNE